jgi:hypothetical protein
MEYFNETLALELEHIGHPILAELYRECKNKKHMCFKRCGNVIVGMQFDPDKQSTLNRNGIVDRRYAKFRSERISEVVFLYEPHWKTTLTQWRHIFANSAVMYAKGKSVQPNSFDTDIQAICAPGIHFFLTLEAALCYEPKSGSCLFWLSNGFEYNVPNILDIGSCLEL